LLPWETPLFVYSSFSFKASLFIPQIASRIRHRELKEAFSATMSDAEISMRTRAPFALILQELLSMRVDSRESARKIALASCALFALNSSVELNTLIT